MNHPIRPQELDESSLSYFNFAANPRDINQEKIVAEKLYKEILPDIKSKIKTWYLSLNENEKSEIHTSFSEIGTSFVELRANFAGEIILPSTLCDTLSISFKETPLLENICKEIIGDFWLFSSDKLKNFLQRKKKDKNLFLIRTIFDYEDDFDYNSESEEDEFDLFGDAESESEEEDNGFSENFD